MHSIFQQDMPRRLILPFFKEGVVISSNLIVSLLYYIHQEGYVLGLDG